MLFACVFACLLALPTSALAVTVGDFELTKTDGSDPVNSDYGFEDGILTVKSSTPLNVSMVSGMMETDDVIVSDPGEGAAADVTLNGVSIKRTDSELNPLHVKSGTLVLRMAEGTVNNLSIVPERYKDISLAALRVHAGATLQVEGPGTLNALINTPSKGYIKAAAIGADSETPLGDIVINGGSVNASLITAEDQVSSRIFAAAIGGAEKGGSADPSITINGGVVLAKSQIGTARGGKNYAAIIGSGAGDGATTSVVITGGTVRLSTNGARGAGIGSASTTDKVGDSRAKVAISGGAISTKDATKGLTSQVGDASGNSGSTVSITGGIFSSGSVGDTGSTTNHVLGKPADDGYFVGLNDEKATKDEFPYAVYRDPKLTLKHTSSDESDIERYLSVVYDGSPLQASDLVESITYGDVITDADELNQLAEEADWEFKFIEAPYTNDKNLVLPSAPTDAGKYQFSVKVPARTVNGVKYAAQGTSFAETGKLYYVTIEKADPVMDLAVTDGNDIVTDSFSYGDTIKVKFTPGPKAADDASIQAEGADKDAPAENEAELWCGDKKLADAEAAEDGSFTLTYGTKGKDLKLGENELTVKYGGSNNLNAGEAKTTVKLAAKSVNAEVKGAITKVYDGTATTTVDLKVPALEGDEVAATATATFEDENVGEGKAVTLSDLQTSGSDAGWYEVALPTGALSGTITKADSDVQLTVGKMDGENFVQTADFTYGESVVVKFEPQIKKPSTLAAAPAVDHAELYYDETKLAEAAKSDDGSFTLTYDTKGKALKLGENELTVRYGGSDNLNGGTATTKVALSRKAVTAEAKDPITKVYDGANTTAVNLTVPTLGEDEVSATAIATFDNADAGEGKAVTLSDLKTSGADAGWYDVALPSGALTGSITKAESDVPLQVGKMDGENFVQTTDLTYGESVVVRFTPQIKATTFAAAPTADHAALYFGEEQLAEATKSDDGSFTLAYDTKGKALKLGSNELVVKYGGSGNLNAGSATTTVTLAKKVVTATVKGDITKVYDGTATTTVDLSVPVLDGDEVSATATAEFADANAGEGKAVTLKDLKTSGKDAGWYEVKLPEGVTGTITKATQPAPAAPELARRTTSSITLKAIAASETSGAAAEYSIDNGATWQDSAEFRRLKSGTRYSFVARYKGTNNYEPSPASEAASFSTNRPAPAPDPDPNPGEPTYPVETPSTEGGSATVDPSTAKPGDTVTISPKPDKGNVVSSITVKDGSGDLVPVTRNADGTFSFVMPDGKVTASVTFVPEALAFTDVDPTAWYARGVHFVSTRGLMTGYEGQRIFGVGDTLTRGQLAVILWRRSGEVPEGFDYHASKNETGIADLADGQYYTAAANWAVKSGVIMGYENPDGSRTFGADDPVTFEQLVTILARLSAKPGEVESADTSVLDRYVDAADVSAWARQAMAWGTESGLYSGYDEGDTHRAAPLENVLRERVATVLMNAYDGGFLK